MNRYNFKLVEKKWQDYWKKNKTYKSSLNKDKKKFTLKRFDKPSSINTRLAPKTIKHKGKKKNKSRGKKTQKTKIDIHLKE